MTLSPTFQRFTPSPSATTSPAISRPGNVRRARRRRILALALHHVGPVDAGGRDLDQHLARSGFGDGALLRHQHFGPARRADRDRGHAAGSSGHVGHRMRVTGDEYCCARAAIALAAATNVTRSAPRARRLGERSRRSLIAA